MYRVAESPGPCIKPARPAINGPADVAALVRPMTGHRQEVFRALLLDARHRLLQKVTVSIGSLSFAMVHPRDVFREAIRRNAGAVVLVHNHPSGDPEPSHDDIELTRRLARAGTLLGVEILDHIIVAKGGFVSLRERGVAFNEGGHECSSRAASTRCGT